MFGLLSRRHEASPASTCARFTRLNLERLETRDAPANLSLSVVYGTGTTVTLSGDLTNTANPANQAIQIVGKASGTTTTDANGHYSITLQATGLGAVGAALANDNRVKATATLTDTAPVITSFVAIEEQNGVWEFRGTITYNRYFDSMTIYFGGQPIDLQNKTTTANSSGSFDVCIQLNGLSSDNGNAAVWAVDPWGLQSNLAMDYIHQTGT
jgi:hypothetical protein